MKSLVIYSSKTGNTQAVANAILEIMPEECGIFTVEEAPEPDSYDLIAMGFWVDRGTADAKAQVYMKKIHNQKVILFATLGAYPDSDHARDCMARAALLMDSSNELLGTFICQGKLDNKLVEGFKTLPKDHPHALTPERIARHQEASKHPNEEDFSKAKGIFQRILSMTQKHAG